MMKTAVLFTFTLLLAAAVLVSGCQNLPSGFKKDQVQGETGATNYNKMARTVDQDRQQFWSDIENFFLLDRPSRLSSMRIR